MYHRLRNQDTISAHVQFNIAVVAYIRLRHGAQLDAEYSSLIHCLTPNTKTLAIATDIQALPPYPYKPSLN
jgi:hypothetical protein